MIQATIHPPGWRQQLPDGAPVLEVKQIGELTFPPAIRLYEYWLDKRQRAGGLPRRAELRAEELLALGVITNVFLLSPVDDSDDWVYRLTGTGISHRFKNDRTGQKFRDYLDHDNAERVIKLNADIVAAGEPRFFNLIPREVHLDWLTLETMSLPVLAPTSDDVWLFGGTFFSDEHGPDAGPR